MGTTETEKTTETMKVTEVITKMSVTDEVINGFRVSAEVEVYNETKEIKSISARITKGDASDISQEAWSYNVTRNISNNMTPSPGVIQVSDPAKKVEALSVGIEFEKAIVEMLQSTNVESLIK